jgi:hypothetical protein
VPSNSLRWQPKSPNEVSFGKLDARGIKRGSKDVILFGIREGDQGVETVSQSLQLIGSI